MTTWYSTIMNDGMKRLIVIGGGLAGMIAIAIVLALMQHR